MYQLAHLLGADVRTIGEICRGLGIAYDDAITMLSDGEVLAVSAVVQNPATKHQLADLELRIEALEVMLEDEDEL